MTDSDTKGKGCAICNPPYYKLYIIYTTTICIYMNIHHA